ncbi:hypothetical protein AMAG_14990 [Allomyces macrogynus ATCC 38327]|uniref:Uncharacterized protein n=1 Tax=Allomyces macrogynus (strain ATCC 38327) TaxID=578462 RepID=A0A0L0T862_ALLM3|nr:hypothetical protein AMAG_14990 [Allomyces macrogynus ATCC 38327]|eukprot:KNE70896.1 hypothetical protein AMAG_14990 [Allomyces macrogynus ATCC 38327]
MASSGNAGGGRRLYVGRKTGETMPADLQFEDDGTIAPEAFINAFAEHDRRATTASVASHADTEFDFDYDDDESLFLNFVDFEKGDRPSTTEFAIPSAIDLGADDDANGAAAPPPAPLISRRHTLSTAAFKTASPLRAPPLTVVSTPSPPPHRPSMSSPVQAAATVTKNPFQPKRVLPRTPPRPASVPVPPDAPAAPGTKTPPHRITSRMVVPSSSPRPQRKNSAASVTVELSQSQDLDLAHMRLDDDDDDDDDDEANHDADEMQVDHEDSHAAEPSKPPTPPAGPARQALRKSTSEARFQYSELLDTTPPPPAPRLGSPAAPAAHASQLPSMDDELARHDEATQTMRGAARTMSPTVHPASLTLSQDDAPLPPTRGAPAIFDRALKPRPKASRPSQAARALFATPAAKGETATLYAPAHGSSAVDRLALTVTPGSDTGTPFDRNDLRRKRERARELLGKRRSASTPASQRSPITAPSFLADIQGPLARTTAALKLQLSQLAAEAAAPAETDRPSSPPLPPQAPQHAARRKLALPVIPPKPVLTSRSTKALLAVRATTRTRSAALASVASAPAAVHTKDTVRALAAEAPAHAGDCSDTDHRPEDRDDNELVSESERIELNTPDHRPMSAALEDPASPLARPRAHHRRRRQYAVMRSRSGPPVSVAKQEAAPVFEGFAFC